MPDTRRLCLAATLVLLAAPASATGPPAVAVAPTRPRPAVFGGEPAEIAVRVSAARPLRGRLVWAFKVGNATVAAREAAVAAGPGQPATVALAVPVPPVKDGVAVRARLAAAVVEAGADKPAAAFEADVWVFPKDPFAGRAEWLKGLKIRLYDPAKATGQALAALNVPFEEVHTPDALATLTDGLVLVGEGVSFKEERGLAAALARLAAGGRRVVCLAPKDGELVVPGLPGPAGGTADLTFRRDPARALDKRLAGNGWPADPGAVASTLAVKPGGGGVVAEAGANAGGWPWAEARFDGPGRWVVCGLSLVARWDDGPAARVLFLRVLEHATDPDRASDGLTAR